MLAFKANAEEIKAARDYVAAIAAQWPVDAYTVRVVVSELVSNAVRHAVTDEVRVDAYVDGDVHVVTVWDADGTLPVPRSPGSEALNGRGLVIVGELATRWGALRDRPAARSSSPNGPPPRRRALPRDGQARRSAAGGRSTIRS